jgi:hypothetical protein
MHYQLLAPCFAAERNADELFKESQLRAEKNPSYVKGAYWGVVKGINSVNELVIEDVYKGSPADKAGIKLGDVVMQIDGIKADKINKVCEYLGDRHPGEHISLLLKRKGRIIKKRITLGLIYVSLVNSVLEKMVCKNIPVRLAIITDDTKIYTDVSDPQVKKTIETVIHSYDGHLLSGTENVYIRRYLGFANFSLIDRQRIESVTRELKFNKSGLVSPEFQTELGKMLGATHLLFRNLAVLVNEKSMQTTVIDKLIEVDSGKVLATTTDSSNEKTLKRPAP